MLRTITIERFKNINHLVLELDKINLLIGSNNAGKSSIQQAIQFSISIAQSTGTQNARWANDRCPSSLSSHSLIYSPLRDIEALAPNGWLQTNENHAIKVTFTDVSENRTSISIRKGKNKNIATGIEGQILGQEMQNIENPYSIIVPGLAGIPAFEEYKPPSIVRKAAAKGDSNSVFRNILLLLSKDIIAWSSFKNKFSQIFPNYALDVTFNDDLDEHINVNVRSKEISLPIDACGTGILQAIQILAYYYLYRPKILILDEPDSHLHPNNQRKLALLLEELAHDEDCQLIISTHSRHFLDALKDNAKIHWIRNFEVVTDIEDLERNILLEIGALDRGDLLGNGRISCVVLTEDEDSSYIKTLIESSGFEPQSTEIWSYKGCSNLHIALALKSFIQHHSPSTQIVLHRDKDFMSEEEIQNFCLPLHNKGIKVFITVRNDTESHFVNAQHISHLYPSLSPENVNLLIDECITEIREKILKKFIDTVYLRKYEQSLKNGVEKPSPGGTAQECQNMFTLNPRDFMHGKLVLRLLRAKIQRQIGGNINFCQNSTYLCVPLLQQFANDIFTPPIVENSANGLTTH